MASLGMDIFLDLWAMAKQGGPFASVMLLLVLYFINEERKEVIKENRALHAKNEALIERLLTGLNEVNGAIKALYELLSVAGAGRKR